MASNNAKSAKRSRRLLDIVRTLKRGKASPPERAPRKPLAHTYARLTILGVGEETSALIEAGRRSLLIDACPTIGPMLRKQGLGIRDIDAILITRARPERLAGLKHLGHEGRFIHGKRPKLYLLPGIGDPLWKQTLRGPQGHGSPPAKTMDLTDYFEIRRLDTKTFDYHGVRITPFKGMRTASHAASYGLEIGHKLLWSGSTGAIPDIVIPWGGKHIVHECAVEMGSPSQARLAELVRTYPRSVRERIWLTSREEEQRLKTHQPLVEREFAGIARKGQQFDLI